VRRLAARGGEIILDVGCGTGLNFAQLEAAVGPMGRLIGIDPTPEMLTQARARAARHGWSNVELVGATAEDAEIPTGRADAVLICGVHDVMRSQSALANVLRHLRDGGRVVAAGAKWAPWWQPGSLAVNLVTWGVNRDYVTTFEGFDRPWGRLAEMLADFRVEEVYAGGGYIAAGTWRPALTAPAG
jgi:demethylmenaquinone methyltransferase/2-methoxy-6-polyprenyl-1,4-benzoquinol methylase